MGITLAVALTAAFVLVTLIFIVIKVTGTWKTSERQAELDHKIKLAIDAGNFAEVDRLRQEKIRIMTNEP